MINAKDTFYLMLRDRLAVLNPSRIASVRGISRPGVVVEENELPTSEAIPDIFRLRWIALAVQPLGALPLAAMTCEIHYTTQGGSAAAGLDRGRLLAAMDSELSAALRTAPHHVLKYSYAVPYDQQPAALLTSIFWSDVVFAPVIAVSGFLARVATIEVFTYEEPGE